MWMIFKVFIELVTVLLLFNVLVFLAKSHMGSWLPNQGSNPHPLFWKVKSEPLDRQGSSRAAQCLVMGAVLRIVGCLAACLASIL